MTATTTIRAAAPVSGSDPLRVYRDDGPLARGIGRALGPALPFPAPVLLLAGVAPLLALIAIAGRDMPLGVTGAVVAWAILLGGASARRPGRLKTRWTETPLLRLTEYVGLLWLAGLEGADAYPAAFALLGALAFRHYDLTYRLRYRAATPARWVDALSGGWDGRLLAGFVLLAAGALPGGFIVAAALLGALFLGEAVLGWTRAAPPGDPDAFEGEEDEGG
jgi:uncharacterized protein DUF5941